MAFHLGSQNYLELVVTAFCTTYSLIKKQRIFIRFNSCILLLLFKGDTLLYTKKIYKNANILSEWLRK